MTHTTHFADLNTNAQSSVDRYARKVTSALTEHADALPHDFSERLRASRARAVSERKHAVDLSFVRHSARAAASTVNAVGGGVAALGGGFGGGFGGDDLSIWNRIASVLPLIGLVVGLWFVSGDQDDTGISEIAQVDAALLSDDLPPAAYADPGFAQFIKNPR